jgi:putative ABC transport system permease protein
LNYIDHKVEKDMISLLKMSSRNIMRNPRRTFLTGTAIGIVVFILTFGQCYLFGMLNQLFESFISTEAGHLKVYHKGYPDKETLLPLDLCLLNSPAMAQAARRIKGVSSVSERLRFFGMLDFKEENEFAVGYGIDPDNERNILNLEEHIALGNYFTRPEGEILIGSGLAENFGIKLGDEVSVISPEIFVMNLKVAGIFQYGFEYLDKKVFYLSLEDARFLLDMEDMASEIVIKVDDKDMAPSFVAPLEKALGKITDINKIEILPWQAQGFLYEMFSLAKVSMTVVLFILFFIAGSTIVNTMMMAVMERTREIGMLMAMGMKAREVMLSVLLEAGTIAVVAGIIGAILGGVLSYVLEQTGIPVGDAAKGVPMPIGSTIRPVFYWWSVPIAFVFGIILTALASLWPARRAGKFDPAQALRSV